MSAPPPHTPTYPTTVFLLSLPTSHGQASRPELVVFSRARLDPFPRGGHGQLTSGCSPQGRPGHLRVPVPMKAVRVTPTLGWFCSGTGWLMGPGDAASAHIYFPWLDAVVSRGQRAPRETAPPPPSISTSYQGLPYLLLPLTALLLSPQLRAAISPLVHQLLLPRSLSQAMPEANVPDRLRGYFQAS